MTIVANLDHTFSSATVAVERLGPDSRSPMRDVLAAEDPLEIRIEYGPRKRRTNRAISVTMRTPGYDEELAAGFLYSEGIVRDASDIEGVAGSSPDDQARNSVCLRLAPEAEVNTAALNRNFYTTSSCGICGKASLLALQSVCPPRIKNTFEIDSNILFRLPQTLRSRQQLFEQTGGLHAAALCTADGSLEAIREDVGRHNAVDKLIGRTVLDDGLPLRDRVLLLSGRASFELLQKALMAGIPLVAAVGAPSSLAVQVAKEFDITLVGFLRSDHFNIYNGAERVRTRERIAI